MDVIESINSIEQVKRQRRITTLSMWGIFLIVFAAEFAGAYIIIYQGEHMMGDALSRTANAYYAIALEPAKLASIGFVWNPLPSLIQLLILPFARFWRPLVSVGFAGYITTALFAGINSALLFRYLKNTKLNVAVTLLIVALYTFNPFIFYYGFNGMSETLFFTAMIMCVANFSLWLDDRKTGRLVVLGLMLAIGFWSRYEIFALMLGFGLAMLIAVYFIEDKGSAFDKKPAKMKWDYSVATGSVIFLPVLYSILIWLFLNLTIMGDPLFFMHSAYSNESQSAVALWSDFKLQMHNPLAALWYIIVRSFPFILPFAVITLERLFTRRLIKADYFILVLLIGSLLGFHYVMLIRGASFGWLRFFCFSLITTVAWIPYELTQLKAAAKKVTIVGLCIAMAASSGIVWKYFQDFDLAREEYTTLFDESGTNDIIMQIEIAKVINEKYSDSTILYDSFTISFLTLNLNNPKNLITNVADNVFTNAILYPQFSGIDYIVVPQPYIISDDGSRQYGVGKLDAINDKYPDLYYEGANWADLVYETPVYRVYKVLTKDSVQNNELTESLHDAALEVADIINNQYSDSIVLLDNSSTGRINKELLQSKNVITLIDDDFDAAVENPKEYQVNYIVVPKLAEDESGSKDAINHAYPELIDNSADWVAVAFENEHYWLYEVL